MSRLRIETKFDSDVSCHHHHNTSDCSLEFALRYITMLALTRIRASAHTYGTKIYSTYCYFFECYYRKKSIILQKIKISS